jgi:hypothetical protein
VSRNRSTDIKKTIIPDEIERISCGVSVGCGGNSSEDEGPFGKGKMHKPTNSVMINVD